MMRLSMLIAIWLAGVASSNAMVGNAPPATDASARAVVTLISSRGSFCSGALIAPDIVLTAAHCVQRGADYRIVDYDAARKPSLRDVRRIAAHPDYASAAMDNHRASADVALVQLVSPLTMPPLTLGIPVQPLAPGRAFRVIGVGVTIDGDGKSGGIARAASLVATGKPGTLQLRLVDPATNNTRGGLGVCTGDSGAPVFEDQNGRGIVVGVVAWSTAAGNAAGCGGLTGVTPLTLYRDWIERTMKVWSVQ